jgi:hypothetical protein
MFTLASGGLRVDLLDPAADRALLGARYAWGGYIWQVHDERLGPLLSGPEFPEPSPRPFNGQGLPESFRHSTRDGRRFTWLGDAGVAIGAGEIAFRGGELHVTAPCSWQIERLDDRARFHTSHAAAGVSYQLVRTVELAGRELRSTSRLTNTGSAPLTLEWFAHPFFALTNGQIRVRLPAAARLPENPGFSLEAGELVQKRRFVGKDDGHLDSLQLPAGEPLRCRVDHPRLTQIDFRTSFVPSECLIWGNGHTFSIEPYLALSLSPRETRDWELRYGFGEISGTASPA